MVSWDNEILMIFSWSHGTMRFSWYFLGLIYVKPPHPSFLLSPCLMVSWDKEILMIFSWSHETMRQGDNEKLGWGRLTLMRPREYHENHIVSWDKEIIIRISLSHETMRQWDNEKLGWEGLTLSRRQREAGVMRVYIYDTKRISW